MHEFGIPEEKDVLGCHVLDNTFLSIVGTLVVGNSNDIVHLYWISHGVSADSFPDIHHNLLVDLIDHDISNATTFHDHSDLVILCLDHISLHHLFFVVEHYDISNFIHDIGVFILNWIEIFLSCSLLNSFDIIFLFIIHHLKVACVKM
jgi:hypothetical protein